MNDHEADRIAGALHVARPDWPAASIKTLIRKHLMDRPRRDAFVALAWVASEPNSSTPARVLETGPWWIAAAVDGQTTGRREPYDPTTFCGICNKPNDQRHPDDHAFVSAMDERRAQVDPQRKADLIEYMRSGIGDAKAEPEAVAVSEPSPSNPRVDELRAIVRPPEIQEDVA